MTICVFGNCLWVNSNNISRFALCQPDHDKNKKEMPKKELRKLQRIAHMKVVWNCGYLSLKKKNGEKLVSGVMAHIHLIKEENKMYT